MHLWAKFYEATKYINKLVVIFQINKKQKKTEISLINNEE